MKRVLFVSASDPLAEIENRYRPLWPGYLAAYAEKRLGRGAVEYRLARRPIGEEIEQFDPDIVAISSVSQNYNRAMQYAREAKQRGRPVIVGGIHTSMLTESMTGEMDVACIGEGEETFAELLEYYLERGSFDGEGLEEINGIAFRRGGGIVKTRPRRAIDNLGDIPHPRRDLTGYPSHSYMFTSRGCPYHCAFCASTRYWDKVRLAPADYVLEEIEELAANGVRTISFYDDLFVAQAKRLDEIAGGIVERGLEKRLRFTCSCRANVVDERTVRALRRMNVVSVGMGLESGNDRVLAYLKGGVTVEDNRRAVELLVEAGIQANASFVIGSPDETAEEMMDTYRFIARSRLAFVDTYVLTPLPGTPVWEYALSRGLVSNDMDWGRLDVNFQTSAEKAVILSEKLSREELRAVHRKFRRQRFWRILKTLPGSPWLADVPKVAWGMAVEKAKRFRRSVTGRAAGRES